MTTGTDSATSLFAAAARHFQAGRMADAEAGFRKLIEASPDNVDALNNLGMILGVQDRHREAVEFLQRAIELNPAQSSAHSNLGMVFQALGRFDEAIASYRRALQTKPDFTAAWSNLVYASSFVSRTSAANLLEEAKRYGELAGRLARPFAAWPNTPVPERRLRIGLVSGDFRQHPVGNFLVNVLSALASTASDRIELIAYSIFPGSDAVTERIRACCREWHGVGGFPDASLAHRIHDDRIDILLDLSGHTAHNRLPMFAWKPAPVQATWLGYLGTTGVAAIDYLIADALTLPPSAEAGVTEKVWRLPESYVCFTPPDAGVPVMPLPALSNGHLTFGSFNNLSKMNDDVVALWAKILIAVPDSRLFLKAGQLGESSIREDVAARFAAHGIAGERLILKGLVAREDHLAQHHRVDIALDPFPYPGITTTVENLWMGVPVLTLAGESFLSRQGSGLLTHAGLPEWIASDREDYVARAVAKSGDLDGLNRLRQGLRQGIASSPIFDAPRFARQFEVALRGMWTKWCEQRI